MQSKADIIREIAKEIDENFHWVLPMYDNAEFKASDKSINLITDDVAEDVSDQIRDFVLGLADKTEKV